MHSLSLCQSERYRKDIFKNVIRYQVGSRMSLRDIDIVLLKAIPKSSITVRFLFLTRL